MPVEGRASGSGNSAFPSVSLTPSSLTHFHHDHISGLADLWLTGWLPPAFGQRQHALKILGPTGTEDVTQGLLAAYARDIDMRVADEGLPRAGAAFDVTEFSSGGEIYAEGDLRVTAFAVNHGELITPAYGYRIDYAGRSVLISGDTQFDENLIEAGIVFQRIQPKLAVYTHMVRLAAPDMPELALADLVAQTRRTYDGPLVVGHDLMTIEIGENVVIYDHR